MADKNLRTIKLNGMTFTVPEGGGSAENGVVVVDVELDKFAITDNLNQIAEADIKSTSASMEELETVIENGGMVFLNAIFDPEDIDGISLTKGMLMPCNLQGTFSSEDIPNAPEGIKGVTVGAVFSNVGLNVFGNSYMVSNNSKTSVSINLGYVKGMPGTESDDGILFDSHAEATYKPEYKTFLILNENNEVSFGVLNAEGSFVSGSINNLGNVIGYTDMFGNIEWKYIYRSTNRQYVLSGGSYVRINDGVRITFLDAMNSGSLIQRLVSIVDTGVSGSRLRVTEETVTLIGGN